MLIVNLFRILLIGLQLDKSTVQSPEVTEGCIRRRDSSKRLGGLLQEVLITPGLAPGLFLA
jgi:hypothetical protein